MGKDDHIREPTQTIQFKIVGPVLPEKRTRRAFITVIRGGPDLGAFQIVENSVVFGRDPACTLCLRDLGISWRHAQIFQAGDGSFVVEDLGSTNGTRVNGVPLASPRPLHEGDKILLGDTVLRFSLADEMDLGFQAEVSQLVNTDPLTGLESKRVFDDALDYALAQAVQCQRPVSILMMDMDGIKAINDKHGHLFGAYAIAQTGRIIGQIIGDSGHACRFGGDEFTAFLPGKERVEAMQTAEKIRLAVERAGLIKDGIPLKPTISIGVATYPSDGRTQLDVLAVADAALYRAKAAGKNCVCQ